MDTTSFRSAPARLGIAGLLVGLSLTGCAGGGADTAAAPAGSTSALSPLDAAVARPPAELIDEAMTNLEAAASFRYTTGPEGGGDDELSIVVDADGDGLVLTADGQQTLYTAKGDYYIKAPASTWKAQGMTADLAKKLADRWIVAPDGTDAYAATMPTREDLLEQTWVLDGATSAAGTTAEGGDAVVVTADYSTVVVDVQGDPLLFSVTTGEGDEAVVTTYTEIGDADQVEAPEKAVTVAEAIL